MSREATLTWHEPSPKWKVTPAGIFFLKLPLEVKPLLSHIPHRTHILSDCKYRAVDVGEGDSKGSIIGGEARS